MGRSLRPYLPGVIFHLTARVHDRERLLIGLQAPIAGLIRSSAASAGARLVAYVVMSNHLHVLAVQGRRPLGDLMQPLLRRSALLVQKACGRSGHVFERRFAAKACLDAEYMRNAVAYIHLNPVRAGLCDDPADYAWSTHNLYCDSARRSDVRAFGGAIEATLQLYAQEVDAGPAACHAAYLAFLAWRRRRDALDAAGGGGLPVSSFSAPNCTGGDVHWARGMAPFAAEGSTRDRLLPAPRVPIATAAAAALRAVDGDMPLDLLRGGGSARPVVHARGPVIAACLEAGYAPRQVARYLNVSTSTISRVGAILRENGGA
jgi:REP element-mobilizing transposase RayT